MKRRGLPPAVLWLAGAEGSGPGGSEGAVEPGPITLRLLPWQAISRATFRLAPESLAGCVDAAAMGLRSPDLLAQPGQQ